MGHCRLVKKFIAPGKEGQYHGPPHLDIGVSLIKKISTEQQTEVDFPTPAIALVMSHSSLYFKGKFLKQNKLYASSKIT